MGYLHMLQTNIIIEQAEVPGAAWVNMQPAEHLCPSGFGFQAPQAQGWEGGGVKPALKLSFARWECECKISSRSVQGFGIPLPLHIPTDGQTDKHLCAHFYIYRYCQFLNLDLFSSASYEVSI